MTYDGCRYLLTSRNLRAEPGCRRPICLDRLGWEREREGERGRQVNAQQQQQLKIIEIQLLPLQLIIITAVAVRQDRSRRPHRDSREGAKSVTCSNGTWMCTDGEGEELSVSWEVPQQTEPTAAELWASQSQLGASTERFKGAVQPKLEMQLLFTQRHADRTTKGRRSFWLTFNPHGGKKEMTECSLFGWSAPLKPTLYI